MKFWYISCFSSFTSLAITGASVVTATSKFSVYSSVEDIINLAHDEYIEKGVERLRANLEDILNRQDKIELNELTLLGMDKISAYISLLFLTAESDYDLEQDEFYSDLYVVKREHVSETDKAIAENVLQDSVNSVMDNVDMIKDSINGTVEIKD